MPDAEVLKRKRSRLGESNASHLVAYIQSNAFESESFFYSTSHPDSDTFTLLAAKPLPLTHTLSPAYRLHLPGPIQKRDEDGSLLLFLLFNLFDYISVSVGLVLQFYTYSAYLVFPRVCVCLCVVRGVSFRSLFQWTVRKVGVSDSITFGSRFLFRKHISLAEPPLLCSSPSFYSVLVISFRLLSVIYLLDLFEDLQ